MPTTQSPVGSAGPASRVAGHGGDLAITAARAHGADRWCGTAFRWSWSWATTPAGGLERGPMTMAYGFRVTADLTPGTWYDDVAKALGADGGTVTSPGAVGAALDRAFAASGPYLVNVLTDPDTAYPRQTTGV